MRRAKEPQYFYAIIDTPYLSKEDLWRYRPKHVVIVLSNYDIDQIKRYMEMTYSEENRNSEGNPITVKFPVEVEWVIYNNPEETMLDEDCHFDPAQAAIYISGEYTYFRMIDYNDGWDIADGEFSLADLKSTTGVELQSVLQHYLEM